MPLRDGTGPFGEGPMTGRALGNCRRNPQNSGFRGRRPRRGRGFRGRGRGYGFRRCFRAARTVYEEEPRDEKEALKDELEALEDEKKAIKERLEELED